MEKMTPFFKSRNGVLCFSGEAPGQYQGVSTICQQRPLFPRNQNIVLSEKKGALFSVFL